MSEFDLNSALVPSVSMFGHGFRQYVFSGQPPRVGDTVVMSDDYHGVTSRKYIVDAVEWYHQTFDDGEQAVFVTVRLEDKINPPPLINFLKKEKKAKPSFVYFVLNPESARVKIGISDNPESRRRDLQTANHAKLELLTMMPGGQTLERWLHDRFANLREEGEWFRFESPLKEFVEILVGGN